MSTSDVWRPSHLVHWTRLLEVDMLRDHEVEIVARYNIDDAAQLEALIEEWIRPTFLSYNDVSQRELRSILDHSDKWSAEEVDAVIARFRMPTGERFKDGAQFLAAMKRAAR